MKVGEFLIEQGGHVPAPENIKTWQLLPHSSGVKDITRLWSLTQSLRKTNEPRHVSGSQNGDLEWPFYKVVKLKSKLPLKTQAIRDARIMGYLLWSAAEG